MGNADFSKENMDLIFEEIMNSNTVPDTLNRRISEEEAIKEKLEVLKNSIKHATDIELQFLNDNLDSIINVMMQNTRIKKDYDYHRSLKRMY